MLLWRGVEYVFYLPFAGIILIRSYGCYLSRPEGFPRQHPGKCAMHLLGYCMDPAKIMGLFSFLDVTFLPTARIISMGVCIFIEPLK